MGEAHSVEKKIVEDVDDTKEWDLDDIPFGFVTFAEMLTSKESLLCADQSDNARRIKISFGNAKFNFTSYTQLSQIIALLPDRRSGIGSSTRIMVKGIPYVLTCAHNLCSVSTLNKSMNLFKKARIYEGREGSGSWKQLWELDLKKSCIHPKYNGRPHCGFDIGFSRIRKRNHKLNGKVKIDDSLIEDDCAWGVGDPKDIESGMKVEVTAYSGQKDSFGCPFTHDGKILDTKTRDNGGCMLYYNLDTTPGTTGGCIMIKNKSYIKKHCKKPGVSKLIIGVHNGQESDGICYGTLITESVLKSMMG